MKVHSRHSSAGEVRRGLIKAGFKVCKRPGFGKKREMLIGITNQKAKLHSIIE